MPKDDVKLVKRVVKGPKDFHWVDPNIKDPRQARKIAKPGDEITVTARAAFNFRDRLIDPELYKAQMKVAQAQKEAAALEEQEQQESQEAKVPNLGTEENPNPSGENPDEKEGDDADKDKKPEAPQGQKPAATTTK